MELEVTVSVSPTARHAGQPLTRAQVDRVVALRARVEAAVAAELARPAAPSADTES